MKTRRYSGIARGVQIVAAAALAWGAAAGSKAAEDWPQFRGARGDGLAPHARLPAQLDAAQHIAWKSALPGRGLSSPIIVGERVFVTCSSGPQQERLHVMCLRASDGSKLWERQFWATGRTMVHEKTSVAAPTAASDGRRIYALFSSNDLVCLDLDGNLIWIRGLTLDYPNASNSLGMAASPVVVGNVLVVQIENDSESFAAGIDAASGVNRWKIERPKAANWTSPLVLEGPQGSAIVALQSSKGVLGIDPASGRELWNYADGASTIPSGVGAGGRLFVPSHGVTLLELQRGQAAPQQLWRSAQLRPGTASLVAVGANVFALNSASVLTAADAATGERLWQLRLEGPFSGSPVATAAHLYVASEKGLLQVVDLSGAEGKIAGQLDLGEPILCTPAIGGNALYLRSDAHLWKIAQRGGS